MSPFRTLALLAGALPCLARIHELALRGDTRFAFSVETFGFAPGGQIKLRASNVAPSPADKEHELGFVIYRQSTEAQVVQVVDLVTSERACALDVFEPNMSEIVPLSDPATWPLTEWDMTVGAPGLYDVLFTHCSPAGSSVSMDLRLEFVNPGGNYLSIGEQPLPAVYGVMCAVFAVAAGVWIVHLRKNKQDVHKVHHLMTLLITLRVVSLICEALMYHTLAVYGTSGFWNVMFYISYFLRGLVMIGVLALVGAGWSLVKPFLSDREKKVLMIALPIQVLNNVAIIVVDEISPGSVAYTAWTIVLHAADIIACIVILAPMAWSIKHLQQAQTADKDEKTIATLKRLTQFRSFYALSIFYIYFTRIIIYVLWQSIAYDRQWVPYFFDEVATLAFYIYVGYRFRPAVENSDYLRVATEEDDPEVQEAAADIAASRATGAEIELTESGASSSATTRAIAPSQSISHVKANVAEVESELKTADGKAASASAAATNGNKKIYIDEERDEDDDFGLDEDEERALGLRPAAAPAARTGLKNVRAKDSVD